MDQLYIDILHTRPAPYFVPRTPDTAGQYQINVSTTIGRALVIKSVDAKGRWHEQITVSRGRVTTSVLSASDNERFVITDRFTDAWIGAFQVPVGGFPQNTLVITDSFLVPPNDLGPTPQPTKTTMIPQDSYPIVVGCSLFTLPNGQYADLLRYQYWHRSDDSYALGVGEEQTITTSTTTGLTSTSSTMETVAASLGMSVSAGWGPISASINASLNTETTTQQSVTISETNTTYISKTLTNSDGTNDILVMHWQLIDVVVITKMAPQNPGDLLASFAVAYAPAIVQTYILPRWMEPLEPGHPKGGTGREE